MTSAISTFLESLAPASAGVGLLDSGSRPADGKGTPPDRLMGATAGGRSASNATSAKRSNEPPRAPPADASPEPSRAEPSRARAYIRTFRAVADNTCVRRRPPHSARVMLMSSDSRFFPVSVRLILNRIRVVLHSIL